MKAKFKCMKCGHKWMEKPAMVTCPSCYHKYVKWTNYESLHKKYFKKMLEDEGL
jgi:Zn finger protein HypA/HybF involved in hydrogenase expression